MSMEQEFDENLDSKPSSISCIGRMSSYIIYCTLNENETDLV